MRAGSYAVTGLQWLLLIFKKVLSSLEGRRSPSPCVLPHLPFHGSHRGLACSLQTPPALPLLMCHPLECTSLIFASQNCMYPHRPSSFVMSLQLFSCSKIPKSKIHTLAGVAQWIPVDQRVAGSIPGQGT